MKQQNLIDNSLGDTAMDAFDINYFLFIQDGGQIIDAICKEFGVACLKKQVRNGVLSLEFADSVYPGAWSATTFIPDWTTMTAIELAVSFTMTVCRAVDGQEWQEAIREAKAAESERDIAEHEAWEAEHYASDPD